MGLNSAKIWLEVQAIRVRGLIRIPVFLASTALFLFSFYMFLTQRREYFGYTVPDIVVGEIALHGVTATIVVSFFGMLVTALVAYKTS